MSAERVFAPTQLPAASAGTSVVREQARVAGYAAGWAAGSRAASEAAQHAAQRVAVRAADAEDEARARLGDALRTLGAAAGAAASRESSVLADATATIVLLALDLAEAIIGVELADGERSARSTLARALTATAPGETVVVRLNPHDHLELQEACADRSLELPAGVSLVDDATLARGDAVSELPSGHLDARLGPAVERLREALDELVSEGDNLGEILATVQAPAGGRP